MAVDSSISGFDQPAWGVLGSRFLYSYLLGGVGWTVLSLITILAGEFPRWVGIGMLVGRSPGWHTRSSGDPGQSSDRGKADHLRACPLAWIV